MDDRDRELLEAAAKAAGIIGKWEIDKAYLQERWYFNVPYDNQNMLSGFEWNPLRDDGDAFRLAVKLHLDINSYPRSNEVAAVQHRQNIGVYTRNIERIEDDPCKSTRRAIVRAAAEIGMSGLP